ncbi:MAG: (Fe-S)-binding protein [Ignisphaera sp.]|uniref:(Fe-S)-binding protein n=1 Tax=Ignisphaera aggregans TaxID=334771 RepID=A0A7J3MZI5_9CREN
MILATLHDALMSFHIQNQPRELFEAVGTEIVEMPRNKLNTYCCGSGGGIIFTFPQLALNSRRRLEEATSIGVKKLIISVHIV